jgi:hypothetical protein
MTYEKYQDSNSLTNTSTMDLSWHATQHILTPPATFCNIIKCADSGLLGCDTM